MALKDKAAVPFRIPPGIQLIRVNRKTGFRAGPGDPDAILEAFKPGTQPPGFYQNPAQQAAPSVPGFFSGRPAPGGLY